MRTLVALSLACFGLVLADPAFPQEPKPPNAVSPSLVQGIREAREATWACQKRLQGHTTRSEQAEVRSRSRDFRRWIRDLWQERQENCERALSYWQLPAPNDWLTAVQIVQRPFPGTESWLLSCSAAEGGHGGFVLYGGAPYYPGAEYAQTFHGDMVGGPMQYMWGTFKGHYRHGLDSLRSRGFIVSLPDPADVSAWLSPLAQAIAAGWARWSGNDNSHWSASFGDGC